MTSSNVISLGNEARWEQANIEAAIYTLRSAFRSLAYPDGCGMYLQKSVGVNSKIVLRSSEAEPVLLAKMYTRNAEKYVAALLGEIAKLRAQAKQKGMAA